jgi:hypothetical protein
MLKKINSAYIGCMVRGLRGQGAYVVHQAWRRNDGVQFVVVQDVQSKAFNNFSLRWLRYAQRQKRIMNGYDWFACTKCLGLGKNKWNSDCPQCEGKKFFWVDVGYTIDDIKRNFYTLRNNEKVQISVKEMLDDIP